MLEKQEIPQLKSMSKGELHSLCDELRGRIIDTVMNNGGHLASNLGMVELTVALHYVFDFPSDKIIFDVGHQCYSHKLLSGRASKFNTLRKLGGLSGFPKREESEYDCYNTGHAGTSISAALGIAKARDIKGENFNVIAVIGDGSFSNGLVYEAFNGVSEMNTNILIILNDNRMSISPTVGTMHEYLEKLSSESELSAKKRRHETIFERFGLSYDGVYDGNDLDCMIEKLKEVKEKLKTRPVILHVLTKKGKGYSYCEENPQETHGISASKQHHKEYSEVLGSTLTALAQKDKRIIAVTAAMTPSVGLSEFFKKYPERSIDAGICEGHAAVVCAALATQGMKPYYAVYSTFLQRAFDEVLVDICSQNLPVTMCIDRAGISGTDGETHQGAFDLSYLSLVPNLTVAVPKDVAEFKKMLEASVNFNYPLAIRYPKDGLCNFSSEDEKCIFGKWEVLREGKDAAILACGERMISLAMKSAEAASHKGVEVSVINARFVKPLDTQLLTSLEQKNIVTLEDNALIGGFGSSIDNFFSRSGKIIKNFAYPDIFIPHGGIAELTAEYGISVESVINYLLSDAIR